VALDVLVAMQFTPKTSIVELLLYVGGGKNVVERYLLCTGRYRSTYCTHGRSLCVSERREATKISHNDNGKVRFVRSFCTKGHVERQNSIS